LASFAQSQLLINSQKFNNDQWQMNKLKFAVLFAGLILAWKFVRAASY